MGTVISISDRREPRLAIVRPAVYTPAETAQRLGVHPKTLYRLEADGRLRPAFRIPGGHRRWPKADVDKLAGGTS